MNPASQTLTLATQWQCEESGFNSADGERLFYRHWSHKLATGDCTRCFVFLHRGHEHSGRIQPLVEQVCDVGDLAFAHDARGHGYSPGARGDAPDFQTLVADLHAFVQHIHEQFEIPFESIFVIANSVGAVVASTWLHDYAVPIRGCVMIATAFDIKLYVPLAKPALRLGIKFNPNLFVTSYIAGRMLTSDPAQAAAYDTDPLIAKSISARILLQLADTSNRIVADAQAIHTPILMLSAGKDYVVTEKPQLAFYAGLSSKLKHYLKLSNSRHAVLYEAKAIQQQAIDAIREFAASCFVAPLPSSSEMACPAPDGKGIRQYEALKQGLVDGFAMRCFYALQRVSLKYMGRLSQGMSIGLDHGFDSGMSLDYVYKNRAQGKLLIGGAIDRGYLDAIGWRGIRLRKTQLQTLLTQSILTHDSKQTLRILDVAAGGGRYALEVLKRFSDRDIQLELRDFDDENLRNAMLLAQELGIEHKVSFKCCDAFAKSSYEGQEKYNIVIVSGLFELFADNAPICQALAGIASQSDNKAFLIYTAQPWHPQLELIAQTLRNHKDEAWVMRPRPQIEMDALVTNAGFAKTQSMIGLDAIFTVSVAARQD